MSKNYYDASNLKEFGKITEWNEELGNKFFDYNGVFDKSIKALQELNVVGYRCTTGTGSSCQRVVA